MNAYRPRLDDATEAYLARLLADTPPMTEEQRRRLSALVTPPRLAPVSDRMPAAASASAPDEAPAA